MIVLKKNWRKWMYSPLEFLHERELLEQELERRVSSYYPDANFDLFKKLISLQKKLMQDKKEVLVKIILFILVMWQQH